MKLKILGFMFLVSFSLSAMETPKLVGRVNDYANVMNTSSESQLEEYLANLESITQAQVVLLTVNSIQGENIEEFSIRTVEKWKLGQEGLDNGVLVTLAMDQRKVRIEIGYGLEQVIPDAIASQIIQQDMIPHFKVGDYTAGLLNGISRIGRTIRGSVSIEDVSLMSSPPVANNRQKSSSSGSNIGGFFLFILIVFFRVAIGFGRSGFGRSSGYRNYSSGSSFRGGFSSGGSSVGRGFSGGGGSFGGGGSSGSW